jgi:hypothetical protein
MAAGRRPPSECQIDPMDPQVRVSGNGTADPNLLKAPLSADVGLRHAPTVQATSVSSLLWA